MSSPLLGSNLSAATLTHLFTPLRHGHRRTLADLGHDVELVHQSSRPRQPESQPAVRAVAVLKCALEIGYAGPDIAGFRNFSSRYRTKYGQDPVRTATLLYDGVALAAALTKTQGPKRFTEDVLTNTSGFNGIDGLFRFRKDGPNQRGLAVMRVSPTGGQIISPSPKSFSGSGT